MTIPSLPASRLPVISFILSFIILSLGLFIYDPSTGGDIYRYIGKGRGILNYLFGNTNTAPGSDLWTVLYIVPNIIIGGGDMLFGPSFPLLYVFFNITLYSLMTASFFKIWTYRSDNDFFYPVAIIGFALLFGLFADVLPHNYWVLSDIMFLSTVAFACHFLFKAILFESKKDWLLLILISIFSVFIRPTGLVLFILSLIALAYVYVTKKYGKNKIFILFLLIAPAIISLIIWPYVAMMGNHSPGWIRDHYPAILLFYYRSGMVVAERPEMYMPHPVGYIDYLSITWQRFFFYYFPLRWTYSAIHNMYLVFYLIFIISFIRMGYVYLRNHYGDDGRNISFLLLLLSYFYGLYHSVLFVEDYRYQLPSLPSLWLLAGFGAFRIKQCIQN